MESMTNNIIKPGTDEIIEKLIQITGAEHVTVHDETEASDSIYQTRAKATVFPIDEEQVVQIVSWANEHQLSVVPQGGGTKDAYGQYTEQADIILSLKKMSGILHHSVGDLIVSVYPGTTLKELQDTLRKEGQYLPLDCPHEEDSTIGGIVAANVSGLKRGMYGSVRDHVIATRIVYPDGRLLRTGAKVVKNVAGYDMNKLWIGSMGTLGILTEITLKIRPVPVDSSFAMFSFSDWEQVTRFQQQLLNTQLEPCALELFEQSIGSEPNVIVTFEDVAKSVAYQLDEVKKIAVECGLTVREEGTGFEVSEPKLYSMRQWEPNAKVAPNDRLIIALKMTSLLTDVTPILEKTRTWARELQLPYFVRGSLMTGITKAFVDVEWGQEAEVMQWIERIQEMMQSLKGHCVIEFAPHSLKNNVSVWGPERADFQLMRGIKRQIDPNGILCPKRFVGGI